LAQATPSADDVPFPPSHPRAEIRARSAHRRIYGELVTTARRALLALTAVAAVLLPPAPALADPPSRLATQITDRADALTSGRTSVDQALSRLQADTGIQLFVVFVDSFDGTPAQEWTDETARLSDLGDRDALLAVATGDRAYAYSFPADPRISDSELTDVAENDIEPALSQEDWSGAVVGAATGLTTAATASSGPGLIWVLVIFVLVIVGAIIWVVVRRRRREAATPAPAQPSGPSTEELTEQANALLIELDDDLRASERELQLAAAQYGAAATVRFRKALDDSRQDVAEAFRLRMTLDDVPAPTETTRRETLAQIIERCRTADARLDAESEDFDRLRDLEGRAAEVADSVEARLAPARASLPAAETAFQDLDSRYAGTTVTAVSTNAAQARERLIFAADELAEARAALADAAAAPTIADSYPSPTGTGPFPAGPQLPGSPGPQLPGAEPVPGKAVPDKAVPGEAVPGEPGVPAYPGNPAVPGGDRAEAALAVRAAEQAVDQAEQLIAAVHQATTDLAAARQAADALVIEVEAELTAGRTALAAGGTVPPGLAAAVTGAEQVLAEVRSQLAAPKPDPVAVVARLQAADSTLDQALAEARDAAERTARARAVLAQALPVARAEVAAASQFITTRLGAVDASARGSLSEAHRHLVLAESLADLDPAAALNEARQAQRLAASAGQYARNNVQNWDSGGYASDSFAGAVLGGLFSGGGGSSSRYRGGGYGGSSSRSRRTSSGGSRRSSSGGGGRRGGGGRF
jgi:hypothetical protein